MISAEARLQVGHRRTIKLSEVAFPAPLTTMRGVTVTQEELDQLIAKYGQEAGIADVTTAYENAARVYLASVTATSQPSKIIATTEAVVPRS